jgi:hypothetical protein
MSKKIITTFLKLKPEVKKAIKEKYPDGVEEHLTSMKNVIKGYFFDGFIFEYEDTTYMIEFKATNPGNIILDDDDDDDLGDMPEGIAGAVDVEDVEYDEVEDIEDVEDAGDEDEDDF